MMHNIIIFIAGVAQLAERDLAKVEVVGSNPIARFKKNDTFKSVIFFALVPRAKFNRIC